MSRLRSRAVRLHFAYVNFGPAELKVDLQILDETGVAAVEVQGLIVHLIGHGAQRMRGDALRISMEARIAVGAER